MAQESPGAPSQPVALSSATPRSRLSKQALGSVDGPSHSHHTLQPTTVRESLLAQHVNAQQTPTDEANGSAEASPLPDGARTRSPRRTKWLIGSPSEDRLVSMTQHSTRRTHSPENLSDERGPTARETKPSDQEPFPPVASLTSASTISPSSDVVPETPVSSSDAGILENSVESLAAKLTVSPQTIPETSRIDHSIESVQSPLMSPTAENDWDPLSRNSSTRSMRMPRSSRILGATSRRSSRRSTSNHTSVSPAHAFLSNWGRAEAAEEAIPEAKPDDEGQAIGLNNEYIIGRTISRGGFGVIKEVHSIENGENVIRAVKIVRKTIAGVSEAENEKAQQEVEHEVSIWRYLRHRHILSLFVAFDTEFATFCVMDLNVGGTLFDLVRHSRNSAAKNNGRKGLPAHLAKKYTYQLACALRYLHEDIRVCHRDVKLENCLVDLTTPNANEEGGNLRLCDFGLADFLHNEGSVDETTADRYGEHLSLSTELPVPTASSIIGTLEYASPKGLSVHRKLFETAGDVWAFGVIVYALCTGNLPFRHSMPSKTAELILRADWDETALREAAAGGGEVIDLVKGCLEKDIDMRFTIADALRSTWFEGCREAAEEEASRGLWQ